MNPQNIVKIGDVLIGGGNKVAIQSMTNTPTYDTEATVKQILDLEKAGCEIVRVSVPDMDSAKAISAIKVFCHLTFNLSCYLTVLPNIFMWQIPDAVLLTMIHKVCFCLLENHTVISLWVCVCSVVSDSFRSHELSPAKLLYPRTFPGKSAGMVCHFLLQGIFLG